MRKKIVATLLALCVVLSLLPITVFAAELTDAQKADLKAQGYTDEQIENVLIIEEDTVLEADEDRLVVIVTPGVTVTVKGATLATGVVVAPGAVDAKVVIAAESNVNAIVVLDKAEVILEENAKATYVTIAAAEATVSVGGEAEKVTVNEVAEGASVNVTSTATVETIEVAAPEAATEIAGAVTTVTVAETATGASTTVASTGTVTDVTVAAPEAETTVAGTVETVAVAETAEGASTTVAASGSVTNVTVDAPNTTVTANGTVENVTVGETATDTSLNGTPNNVVDESSNIIETNKPSDTTPDDIIPGDTTENPYVPTKTAAEKVAEGIIAAPLDDHAEDKNWNGSITATAEDPIINGLASKYEVQVNKSATKDATYDVTIIAEDVIGHTNTADQRACFVGISIPVEDGWTYTYFTVTETTVDGTTTTTRTKVDAINHWSSSGTEYDTFYWGFAGGDKHTADATEPTKVIEIEMSKDVTDPETGDTETVTEKVTLDIRFDVESLNKDGTTTEGGEIAWTEPETSAAVEIVNNREAE